MFDMSFSSCPPHLNLSCFCSSRPLTPFFPPILHNNEEQRLTAPNSFAISLSCLYICLQHLTFPCFTFSLTLSAPHPYLSIPPSFPFHFHFLCCSPSNASFPNVIASCPNFLLFSTELLQFFNLSFLALHPSLFLRQVCSISLSKSLSYARNPNCLLPFPVSSTVHLSPEAGDTYRAASNLASVTAAIHPLQTLDMTFSNT